MTRVESELTSKLATFRVALAAFRRGRRVRRFCAWIAIVCIIVWYTFGGVLLLGGKNYAFPLVGPEQATTMWLALPAVLILLFAVPVQRYERRKSVEWRNLGTRVQAAALAWTLAETLLQHAHGSTSGWVCTGKEVELFLELEARVYSIAVGQLKAQPFDSDEEDRPQLALPAVLERTTWPAVVSLALSHRGDASPTAQQAADLLKHVSMYLVARDSGGEDSEFRASAVAYGREIEAAMPAQPIPPRVAYRTVAERLRTWLLAALRPFQFQGRPCVLVPVWFATGYVVGFGASRGDAATAAVVGGTFVAGALAAWAAVNSPPGDMTA